MAKKKRASGDGPANDISLIRKKLKHFPVELEPTEWLSTGNERLNAVLGSPERGIPYGKMIELYGPQSHGKTMIALLLSALAQKDGAAILWMDLENQLRRGLGP